METQVELFDDYENDCLEAMNNFMVGKEIVDVKMNTVVANTGNFFTRYLVIYKESSIN